LARRASENQPIEDNIIEADFLKLTSPTGMDELKNLPASRREEIEAAEGQRLARAIADRLPRDDNSLQQRIRTGHELANRMSWEHVVQEYFLPSLDRATNRQ
jgi:hypothetical protein